MQLSEYSRWLLPSTVPQIMLSLMIWVVTPHVIHAGEIRTLDGKSFTGDITNLTPAEVRIKQGDDEKVFPLKDVITIDWGTPSRPATRVPYLRVRLIDGSQVYCLTLAMQNKSIKLLLISGQSISVTFDQVHSIVCDAHETASLVAFEALTADNPRQDFIRVQSREGNTIEPYDGIVQGANEQGNRLLFKARGLDNVSTIDVARLRGVYFSRDRVGPDDTAIARIVDTFGNSFTVKQWKVTDQTCDLTTQTGHQLVLVRSTVQRFDLTPGKLVYLSDLQPTRVEETPILADLFRYRRDKNLEGGPLSVGRRVYPKGLALHSKTILEYDVKGYASFRCILGIDDAMTGSAHAVVRIEGDDKELLNTNLSSRENKPQDIVLAIQGVQKLRLVVDYGEDFDLGDHINFADARLIK